MRLNSQFYLFEGLGNNSQIAFLYLVFLSSRQIAFKLKNHINYNNYTDKIEIYIF